MIATLEAKLDMIRSQRASIIEEKQTTLQRLNLYSIDGLLAMRIANLINEYYQSKIDKHEPKINVLEELIKEQRNDHNGHYFVSFDRSDSTLLSPPTAVIETGSQLRP